MSDTRCPICWGLWSPFPCPYDQSKLREARAEILVAEDNAAAFADRAQNTLDRGGESEMSALTAAVLAVAYELRTIKIQLDPLARLDNQ